MKPFALLYPLPSEKARNDEKSMLSKVSSSSHAPVNVKALRYEHVGTTAESTIAAFHDDPLHAYIRAGKEGYPHGISKTNTSLQFTTAIRARHKIVLTVNAGEANVIAVRSKA